MSREQLVERLRRVIGWVSERDHGMAVELDLVVHELEELARSEGNSIPVTDRDPL
jgi:hypothetical protein